jgi:hypothetical protein
LTDGQCSPRLKWSVCACANYPAKYLNIPLPLHFLWRGILRASLCVEISTKCTRLAPVLRPPKTMDTPWTWGDEHGDYDRYRPRERAGMRCALREVSWTEYPCSHTRPAICAIIANATTTSSFYKLTTTHNIRTSNLRTGQSPSRKRLNNQLLTN